MVRSGVPETVAMSIAGHRTRSMFDRYNITGGTDQRLALERVQEHLASTAAEPRVLVPLQPRVATAS